MVAQLKQCADGFHATVFHDKFASWPINPRPNPIVATRRLNMCYTQKAASYPHCYWHTSWQAGRSLCLEFSPFWKSFLLSFFGEVGGIGYFNLLQVWKEYYLFKWLPCSAEKTWVNNRGGGRETEAKKRVLTSSLSIIFTYGLWHLKRIHSQDVGV